MKSISITALSLLALGSFLVFPACQHAAPLSPPSTTAPTTITEAHAVTTASAGINRANFATGIRILYRYARVIELEATNTSISSANVSVISRTCMLFSTYKTMRESDIAEFPYLTSLLQSTMIHGCFHVRDLLGQPPAVLTAEEGSGKGPVDSCAELQYLDTLCSNAAQTIKQSVVETARNILNTYIDDENFNTCTWLHDNKASQHLRNLFSC